MLRSYVKAFKDGFLDLNTQDSVVLLDVNYYHKHIRIYVDILYSHICIKQDTQFLGSGPPDFKRLF